MNKRRKEGRKEMSGRNKDIVKKAREESEKQKKEDKKSRGK